MGKQGPCYHCGVTSTPLWRNGPPDKPVLCNACGSRWRTKGTLANYTPLHARPDSDDFEDQRAMRVKSISLSKSNELKRKQSHDSATMVGGQLPDYSYNQGFRKAMDEEASNRSSSGSAISNSESCAQFGGGDASDLTGQAQSIVWESLVPSKRRTCMIRPKQSPVEKLTKDLYTIWQEQQSSYFSGSTEEDLLFESETPMVSVETGHGSVLIKHPNLIAKEEESEASSLSVDNKHSHSSEAYSHSAALYGNKGANFVGHGNAKMKISGHGTQQVPLRREKSHLEIFQMLGSHKSPLCHIDLSNALDYEVFVRHLTNEEQHKLSKYLPSVDVAKLPESLKSMFESPQFKENVVLFQQLLGEGLFDMTLSGEKPEDCKALRKLVISNLSKSKWVEHYSLLKSSKSIVLNSKASSRTSVVAGPNVASSSNLTNVKRQQDNQNKKFPDAKIVMKSPKRVIMKNSYEKKDTVENESSCFSPRSLFALPPESSSFLLDPINFVEEGSDQDLLLDVPSNGSFAQAELLHPSLSFGSHQASTSSSSVYTHVSSSLKNNIPAFVEP